MRPTPDYPHAVPSQFPADEHEEGVAAFGYGPHECDHLPLSENPYRPGSQKHYAWWVGWHDAASEWSDEASAEGHD